MEDEWLDGGTGKGDPGAGSSPERKVKRETSKTKGEGDAFKGQEDEEGDEGPEEDAEEAMERWEEDQERAPQGATGAPS